MHSEPLLRSLCSGFPSGKSLCLFANLLLEKKNAFWGWKREQQRALCRAALPVPALPACSSTLLNVRNEAIRGIHFSLLARVKSFLLAAANDLSCRKMSGSALYLFGATAARAASPAYLERWQMGWKGWPVHAPDSEDCPKNTDFCKSRCCQSKFFHPKTLLGAVGVILCLCEICDGGNPPGPRASWMPIPYFTSRAASRSPVPEPCGACPILLCLAAIEKLKVEKSV